MYLVIETHCSLADELFRAYEIESLLSKTVEDASIVEVLRTRHLRIPFFLCWFAMIAGAVSGNALKCKEVIFEQESSAFGALAGYMNELFISFGIDKRLSILPVIGINVWSLMLGMSVAIVLVEKIGRRPLLLTAIITGEKNNTSWLRSTFRIDMIGITCMVLADWLSPCFAAEVLGFSGFLLLTTAIVLGLYKIPVLYIAEICPQGAFMICFWIV